MKSFIALTAALMMLLFGFSASTEVAVVEDNGAQVCSDLPLRPYPYD